MASRYSPGGLAFTTRRSGRGTLVFRRAGARTVLAEAFAASPLRVLTPRNHGAGAWVFLGSFGGGLVGGDHFEVRVDAEADTLAFLGTQASTKVYRSAVSTSQTLHVHVAAGASLAIVPDPVVAFAGADYRQTLVATLGPDASLLVFDALSCGRAARGERWQFRRFESRTTVMRAASAVPVAEATGPGPAPVVAEATWLDPAPLVAEAMLLDPAHGSIARRMGPFGVVASLVAIGPRFAGVRDAILAERPAPAPGAPAVWVASAPRDDLAVARVVADRFENASRLFSSSFAALARALGDDPFSRKW